MIIKCLLTLYVDWCRLCREIFDLHKDTKNCTYGAKSHPIQPSPCRQPPSGCRLEVYGSSDSG